MRFRMALLAVVVLGLSATIARADGVDPVAAPGRGPTGSPTCGAALDLSVSSSGTVTDDCTVVGGTITEISITFPEADVELGITCGVSDAFVDGGIYDPATGGFAAVPDTNGDGGETCNWGKYPTPPNYRTPGMTAAQIAQLEALCLATNSGGANNPQDCEGVPAGTDYSDVEFVITGAIPGVSLSGTEVITPTVVTPEPTSLALLVLGIGSLAFFYRRRQLA